MTQAIPSLPSSGASSQGLSTDFQPDLATGTGNYSVALDLPKGPRGFRPELALSYSSGAGQGSFGQGWSLSGIMTIHVSTRKGVPNPANPDARAYTLGGDNELVCVADLPSGDKLYRPQTYNHNWHIVRSGDAWTVTSADGTRYRCGTSDNSRVTDPDSGEIMEWHLAELVSPTGQAASFGYRAFGPGRSISEIAYGPFSVEFEYEPRPDQFTTARYGFPIRRDSRCHTIHIRSERSPHAVFRSYKLGYLESRHTQISQLGWIQQASDIADDALAFPPLSFSYSDWSSEDVTLQRLSFDGEMPPPPSAATAAVLDLDGRGLPGLLEGTNTGWRFWRNLGAGRFAAPTDLSNAPIGIGLGTGDVGILDLEGNGTADLLQISGATQGFFPNAAGGAFEAFVDYGAMPPVGIGDPSVRFVDIDGDGVVDAIKSEADAFLLFQNTGKGGWSDAPLRIPRIFDRDVFPDVDFTSDAVFFADMSGDGLPDIVELRAFETVYWPYRGHGRWGRKVTMLGQPAFPPGFDIRRARLLDIDGDGLSDLVYLDDTQVRIWRNVQGGAWSEEITADMPAIFVEDVDVLDIFGVGHPALVLSGPDPDGGIGKVLHALDVSGGALPNLLTEIRSGLGHVTRIAYGVSTEDLIEDEAGGAGWSTFLPVPVPVCRSVENTDLAAGITQRRFYRYHNGHYCGIDREFSGFNVVEEAEDGSGDAAGKRTVTQFHVGTEIGVTQSERLAADPEAHRRARALRGSPLEVQVFETQTAGADRKLRKITSRYDTRVEHASDTGLVVRPFVVQVVEDELATDGTANRTIWDHDAPNADGHVERVQHSSGPVAADGSWTEEASLTEVRRFAKPAPGGATGPETFLASRVVTDGNGQTMAAERWLYDGDPFEGLAFGTAERGLIARHDELVFTDAEDPGTDPEARGFFRLDTPELPTGWYRCRERKSHNAAGNPVAILDAFDQRASLDYDAHGIDLVTVTDAAGRVTTVVYDHAVEQPRALIYPSGVVEQRDFDRLGRVTASYRTDADGRVQLINAVDYANAEYGPLDRIVTPANVTTYVCRRPDMTVADIDRSEIKTTEDAFVLRRFYGASGIEIGAVTSAQPDPSGNKRTLRSAERFFDRKGRVQSEGRPAFERAFDWVAPSSAADRAFVATRDAYGRTTELLTSHGRREIAIEPRSIDLRDPNNVASGEPASIRQEFDGFGRLVYVREATSAGGSMSKSYAHDARGDLLRILESDGSELAVFAYDRVSKRTKIDHRDAGARRFEYDAMGRLSRAEIATGQELHYSYDAIGRLVEVRATEADGNDGGAKRFHYDIAPDGSFSAPSRLCAVEQNGELTHFRYDAAGRLTEKTRMTADAGPLSFRYAYDFLGNISELTYPNGITVKYRYGPSGEIVGIDEFVDAIEYTERGFPKQVRYSNGVTTDLAFHDDDRLRAIAVQRGSDTLFAEQLVYDANGNISKRVEALANDPEVQAVLTYDLANRITGGTARSSTSTIALRVAYDGLGNVVENSEHGLARLTYDSERPGLLTSIGVGPERRYDAAGRTISTEALPILAYDAFDRLRRVEKADGTVVEFQFDHLGGRTRRTTKHGASVDTVHTMDDLFERGPDGDRMIIRGPLGIAAIVYITSGDTRVEFCHGDHLGSVRCRTDAAAKVIGTATFTAFGAVKMSTDFGLYAGKFGDEDLGLIQMGQRFYEPLTGRFLTPDTYLIERPEISGGMPGLLDPFGYAANNPIRNVDPTGRFPVLAAIIIGAVIGAAVGAAAAQEQGEDPLLGALVGGLVGGLIGWAGLGAPALLGAGIGALTSHGDRVWTGALVGGIFGAIGGAVGQWLPVIPGDSGASALGNYFLEIVADGLVAGLSAGTTAALNGRDFGDAFESAFITGAVMSHVRIMFFGVRYDPMSVRDDVISGTEKEWVRQSKLDTDGPWSSATNKAGMPNINKVTIRRGGILTGTGRSHAIAPGGISLSEGAVAEIADGKYVTLAHELRHITQQNVATWGYLEFAVVWLGSDGDLHYTNVPGNGGEAPY